MIFMFKNCLFLFFFVGCLLDLFGIIKVCCNVGIFVIQVGFVFRIIFWVFNVFFVVVLVIIVGLLCGSLCLIRWLNVVIRFDGKIVRMVYCFGFGLIGFGMLEIVYDGWLQKYLILDCRLVMYLVIRYLYMWYRDIVGVLFLLCVGCFLCLFW